MSNEIQTETDLAIRSVALRILKEIREMEAPIDLIADKRVTKLLYDLYSKIWCEACYDPMNESSRKFAHTLLPDIQSLNDILKFKK